MKETVKNPPKSENRDAVNFNESDSAASSDHYQPSLHLVAVSKAAANDACGFLLTRNKWDPYPWVSSVDARSPSEMAGLKAGDCLLEVNGEDVLGLRIANIATVVKKSLSQVTLLIWRNGRVDNCNPESVCCGPLPRSLERLATLAHSVLAIIECPVCLNTIDPPAMQCQNGHLICVECRIRAITCPVCRDRYTPQPSLIAEQIHAAFTTAFKLSANRMAGSGDAKIRTQIFGSTARPSKQQIVLPTATAPKQRLFRKLLQPQRYTTNDLERQQSNASGRNNSQTRCKRKFLKSFNVLRKSFSMVNLAATTEATAAAGTNQFRMSGVDEEVEHHEPTQSPLKHFSLSVNDLSRSEHSNDNDNDEDRPSCSASLSSSLATHTAAAPTRLSRLTRENRALVREQPTASICSSDSSSSMASSQEHAKRWPCHAKDVQCIQKQSSALSTSTTTTLENPLQFMCSPLDGICDASKESPTKSSHFNNELLSKTTTELAQNSPVGPSLHSTTASTSSSSSFEFIGNDVGNLATPLGRYRCPFDCGRRFNASAQLQHHVKVIHQKPILSFGGSPAMLSLPLMRPIDDAVLILDVDGHAATQHRHSDTSDTSEPWTGDSLKDATDESVKNDDKALRLSPEAVECNADGTECWIRIQNTKYGIHLAGLLLNDSDESVDFVMETRLLSLNANDKLPTFRNANTSTSTSSTNQRRRLNAEPKECKGEDEFQINGHKDQRDTMADVDDDDDDDIVIENPPSSGDDGSIVVTAIPSMTKTTWQKAFNQYNGRAVNTHGSNAKDDGIIHYGQHDDILMTGDFLLNINVQQRQVN